MLLMKLRLHASVSVMNYLELRASHPKHRLESVNQRQGLYASWSVA
jgi:hypothetical protein